MNDEQKARELAQICAFTTDEAHGYLPDTPSEALDFEPHKWVLDAIALAFEIGRREEKNK